MFGSTVTLQTLSLAKYYTNAKQPKEENKKQEIIIEEKQNIIEQPKKEKSITPKEYLKNYENSIQQELENNKIKEL